jgi:hypothetical protein
VTAETYHRLADLYRSGVASDSTHESWNSSNSPDGSLLTPRGELVRCDNRSKRVSFSRAPYTNPHQIGGSGIEPVFVLPMDVHPLGHLSRNLQISESKVCETSRLRGTVKYQSPLQSAGAVSNRRPLPCQGSALPLSYQPEGKARVAGYSSLSTAFSFLAPNGTFPKYPPRDFPSVRRSALAPIRFQRRRDRATCVELHPDDGGPPSQVGPLS